MSFSLLARPACFFTLASILLVACLPAIESPGFDSRRDAGRDAHVDSATMDASGPDASRLDGGLAVSDAGISAALTPTNLSFFKHGGLGMPCGLVNVQGRLVALGVDVGTGQLILARASEGEPFALDSQQPSVRAFDCSTIASDGVSYAYFTGQINGVNGSYRARIGSSGLVAVQAVALAANELAYWTQTSPIDDSTVLLSFTSFDRESAKGYLQKSDTTGLRFTDIPVPFAAGLRGLLVHGAQNLRGEIAFLHQEADASWSFRTYLHLQQNGIWSQALPLEPSATQVHDAYPVVREDGDFDVYYLRDTSIDSSFSVYRRHLRSASEWGPEERVTSIAVGHVEKPQVRRVDGFGLMISFAVREGSEYALAVAKLESDAAR